MSYVMANIKLPLLVSQDGGITPLIDHISIVVENCDKLPEKIDTDESHSDFMEQIKSVLYANTSQNEIAPPPTENIMVLPEEIIGTKRSPCQNITLKNYKNQAKYRNTAKRR